MASERTEMTFQVTDAQGHAYHVQLAIDEQAATGILVMRRESTGVVQQHRLDDMQKSHDGKTLQCTVGVATATLTIQDAQIPPRLHLQARVFVPVMDETYTLQPAEQQRLSAWMQALRLKVLG